MPRIVGFKVVALPAEAPRILGVCLGGAVLMEQNDEWTEARRYMSIKVLAKIGASDDMSAEVNAIEAISA